MTATSWKSRTEKELWPERVGISPFSLSVCNTIAVDDNAVAVEIAPGRRIGDPVSIQHLEPVEHIHMSHSFVRGNWRNTDLSTPMLLSKSCHDLDILRWIIGKPCRKVQSFGSLTLFRPEMAPAGAAPMQAEDFRQALKQNWSVRLALWRLIRHRWVRREANGFNLTAEGLRQGGRIIRSHRLWESFFCGKMGYCETDVHTPAHHLEHFTDDGLQTRLEDASERPRQDPHRRRIPPR